MKMEEKREEIWYGDDGSDSGDGNLETMVTMAMQ